MTASGARRTRLEEAIRRNRARNARPGARHRVAEFLGRPEESVRFVPLEATDALLETALRRSPFIYRYDDGRAPRPELWVDDRAEAIERFERAVRGLPDGDLVLLDDDATTCGGVLVSRDEVLATPERFVADGEADPILVTEDGMAGVQVNGFTDAGHRPQRWGIGAWGVD